MKQQALSVNAAIMSFMLACLIFGFLAAGAVAAAPLGAKSAEVCLSKLPLTG